MDRIQILDSRIRFEPNLPRNIALAWDFYATRVVRHGGGPVTQRKFCLLFKPSDRCFIVHAVRRVSKRKKRRQVKVSAGMVRYLRSRLPPEALAACARASLHEARRAP